MKSLKMLLIFMLTTLLIILSLQNNCVISQAIPDEELPNKLPLPQNATGPEDLAFDGYGGGPYTGVADGRILKYENGNFNDFATTSPLRTKEKCDGTTDPKLGPICGKPLGLDFDRLKGVLYIADVFLGLVKVDSKGGLATPVATAFNGRNFSFPNAVAVDETTGDCYFTDSGQIFLTFDYVKITQSGDKTGKVFKYSSTTNEVTEVLLGLSGPAGLALNKDRTFFLVSEFIRRRILKHYIKGPFAGKTETILGPEELQQGYPDNIDRAVLGGFWVASNIILPKQPRPRPTYPRTYSIAIKFDLFGKILEKKNLTNAFPNTFSVYREKLPGLEAYVGSLGTTFVAKYRKLPI